MSVLELKGRYQLIASSRSLKDVYRSNDQREEKNVVLIVYVCM